MAKIFYNIKKIFTVNESVNIPVLKDKLEKKHEKSSKQKDKKKRSN